MELSSNSGMAAKRKRLFYCFVLCKNINGTTLSTIYHLPSTVHCLLSNLYRLPSTVTNCVRENVCAIAGLGVGGTLTKQDVAWRGGHQTYRVSIFILAPNLSLDHEKKRLKIVITSPMDTLDI